MRYSFSINEKTYNGGEKFNDAAISAATKDVIYSITVAAALTVAA